MKSIDGDRVRRAIREAEQGTSGRIVVHVTDHAVTDSLERAREAFVSARLHEHVDRNAVLFLVSPKGRTFAVYGGDAIHDSLGASFWEALVAQMQPYFARGEITDALTHGIRRVGDELHSRFPMASPA
ncbi:MAG TPA: TPM domain-containing protein [Candidatus Baltobacteraceae bacterium]|nr:TPM domain-containing protein [Candidatus Baltobacteraceae bacterium]